MIYGMRNGKKVKAEPGMHAECPHCGEEVISRCGEINRWHLAHKTNCECDSWLKCETEWHLKWKMLFPEKNVEVTIEKHGVRHRADVQLDDGMVIEFQNGDISTIDIKKREEFYDNMVWVFNMYNFKGKKTKEYYQEFNGNLKLKEYYRQRYNNDNIVCYKSDRKNTVGHRLHCNKTFFFDFGDKIFKVFGDHKIGKDQLLVGEKIDKKELDFNPEKSYFSLNHFNKKDLQFWFSNVKDLEFIGNSNCDFVFKRNIVDCNIKIVDRFDNNYDRNFSDNNNNKYLSIIKESEVLRYGVYYRKDIVLLNDNHDFNRYKNDIKTMIDNDSVFVCDSPHTISVSGDKLDVDQIYLKDNLIFYVIVWCNEFKVNICKVIDTFDDILQKPEIQLNYNSLLLKDEYKKGYDDFFCISKENIKNVFLHGHIIFSIQEPLKEYSFYCLRKFNSLIFDILNARTKNAMFIVDMSDKTYNNAAHELEDMSLFEGFTNIFIFEFFSCFYILNNTIYSIRYKDYLSCGYIIQKNTVLRNKISLEEELQKTKAEREIEREKNIEIEIENQKERERIKQIETLDVLLPEIPLKDREFIKNIFTDNDWIKSNNCGITGNYLIKNVPVSFDFKIFRYLELISLGIKSIYNHILIFNGYDVKFNGCKIKSNIKPDNKTLIFLENNNCYYLLNKTKYKETQKIDLSCESKIKKEWLMCFFDNNFDGISKDISYNCGYIKKLKKHYIFSHDDKYYYNDNSINFLLLDTLDKKNVFAATLWNQRIIINFSESNKYKDKIDFKKHRIYNKLTHLIYNIPNDIIVLLDFGDFLYMLTAEEYYDLENYNFDTGRIYIFDIPY